jgi:hypothetical protein
MAEWRVVFIGRWAMAETLWEAEGSGRAAIVGSKGGGRWQIMLAQVLSGTGAGNWKPEVGKIAIWYCFRTRHTQRER